MAINRRQFIQTAFALMAMTGLSGCGVNRLTKPKVVVVGGGFGGATAARYLAKWVQDAADITLVSKVSTYTVCPSANLFIGDLSPSVKRVTYHDLRQHRVRVLLGEVTEVDRQRKWVKLASGQSLDYDYLVLAPGVGYSSRQQDKKTSIAAWGELEEIELLAKQVRSLKAGDNFVITVPMAPYKCPPAPYERACLVANYIQKKQLDARVTVLDENAAIASKPELFQHAFQDYYSDIIDYLPETPVVSIDPVTKRITTPFDEIEATIINQIPAQKAHQLLVDSGLIPKNKAWCPVIWQTMQSIYDPSVYVVGDVVESVYALPKSAHVANNQAKVCAAAITREILKEPLYTEPVIMNCCFSYLTEKTAVHVASVCRFDPETKSMEVLQGTHKQSKTDSELEAIFAREWLNNIVDDTFGV